MKKLHKKQEKQFPFAHRFLSGLIIALALTLTAFEWTTYTVNTEVPILEPKVTDEDDLILPPITYRKVEPPKKNEGNKIKVVKEILEPMKPIVTPLKPIEPIGPVAPIAPVEPIDPKAYGMDDDDLPPSNIPFVKVEVFAHYDACAGLTNDELKECSLLDLSNKIKKNFKVTEFMKDIGGLQAAHMTFIVDEEGNIHSIEAIESSSNEMTKAATKAIKKLPKMNPAQQRGRAVSLRMKIPIMVNIRQ